MGSITRKEAGACTPNNQYKKDLRTGVVSSVGEGVGSGIGAGVGSA